MKIIFPKKTYEYKASKRAKKLRCPIFHFSFPDHQKSPPHTGGGGWMLIILVPARSVLTNEIVLYCLCLQPYILGHSVPSIYMYSRLKGWPLLKPVCWTVYSSIYMYSRLKGWPLLKPGCWPVYSLCLQL